MPLGSKRPNNDNGRNPHQYNCQGVKVEPINGHTTEGGVDRGMEYDGMTCPRCGGKGTIYCTRCGGKGYLWVEFMSAEEASCEECDGTGEITCPNCDGTGNV